MPGPSDTTNINNLARYGRWINKKYQKSNEEITTRSSPERKRASTRRNHKTVSASMFDQT